MHKPIIIAAILMSSSAALAGPECTREPKTAWIAEETMKARIAAQGYKYDVFKVTDGNCYEIYGRNAAGKRIEIYFHPVTGALVEEHEG